MTGWRAVRTGPEESGDAWVAALSTPGWDQAAALLKRDTGTSVWRATMLGREVVIKCWVMRGSARAKAWVRLSRSHRHWRGAARLQAHGFLTAPCLALLRRRAGHTVVEALIMEHLPGRTVLEHLAERDLPIAHEHALARALGRLTARMNAAGCFNRDHKPSNLIVTNAGADPRIAVIDCVAIGGRPNCTRMLFNLLIETIGVQHMPRRAVLARVLTAALLEEHPALSRHDPRFRAAVSGRWGRIIAMVRGHGDPAPRVLPFRQSQDPPPPPDHA